MSCPRENEILDALMAARWPDACDAELRAHATACTSCADLVIVAGAIVNDAQTMTHAAHVPPSGAMWWRMQRRDREHAARAASRTITIVQGSSIAAAIAIAVTIIGGVSWISPGLDFSRVLASVPHWSLPVLGVFAASLTLTPLAVYFVLRED
jgi:hypothetical protein